MEKINLYVAVEQMKRITISGGTFSIKFRKWNRQTRDGGDMVILTAARLRKRQRMKASKIQAINYS